MIKTKRRLNPGLVFFSDVYEKMAEGTRSLDPFAALYLTANFVKVNNRKPFFLGVRDHVKLHAGYKYLQETLNPNNTAGVYH